MNPGDGRDGSVFMDLERRRVWFPAAVSGDSRPPVTPAVWHPVHLSKCVQSNANRHPQLKITFR